MGVRRAVISYLKWGLPVVLGVGLILFYGFGLRVFRLPPRRVASISLAYVLGVSILEVMVNYLEERASSPRKVLQIRLARVLILINATALAYFIMMLDSPFCEFYLVVGLAGSAVAYSVYRSAAKQVLQTRPPEN